MEDIQNTSSSSDQQLLLNQQFNLVVELVDKVYKLTLTVQDTRANWGVGQV